MSMHLMNEAWKVKLNSPIQKLVLLALSHKAGNHGDCHACNEEIAEMCELPLHTTEDALRNLIHKGYICKMEGFFCVYKLMI